MSAGLMTFLTAADEGVPVPTETPLSVETVDATTEQTQVEQPRVVEPLPVEPVPVEPLPVDPAPVEPQPGIEPAPVDPVVPPPTEPLPVEQPPVDQPPAVEPLPVDPVSVSVVEPQPADPMVVPAVGQPAGPVDNQAPVQPQPVVEQPIAESVVVLDPLPIVVDAPVVSEAPAGVSGQILLPLRNDSSGIVVILSLPDGSTLQTVTNSVGMFAFGGLQPGNYRIDAGAVGFLSVQVGFSLTGGQVVNLAPVTLTAGDTNLDNVIDLRDAALIAANFNVLAPIVEADVNRDGLVDIRDLTTIGVDFGRSGPLSWE
jgi:hypothetical protein